MGTDARRSLPAAMLLGGLFALLCDDLGRALYNTEIPLGILTSLIGALGFAVLMIGLNAMRIGYLTTRPHSDIPLARAITT